MAEIDVSHHRLKHRRKQPGRLLGKARIALRSRPRAKLAHGKARSPLGQGDFGQCGFSGTSVGVTHAPHISYVIIKQPNTCSRRSGMRSAVAGTSRRARPRRQEAGGSYFSARSIDMFSPDGTFSVRPTPRPLGRAPFGDHGQSRLFTARRTSMRERRRSAQATSRSRWRTGTTFKVAQRTSETTDQALSSTATR